MKTTKRLKKNRVNLWRYHETIRLQALLRKQIRENKVTVTRMSQDLGISRQQIYNYLDKSKFLYSQTIEKIKKYLGA